MSDYELYLAECMTDQIIDYGIRAAVVLPAIGKDEDVKPVIRNEGEDTEHLLKRFKRKVSREGIIDAFKAHKAFKSKSERQHEKHKRALYRAKLEGRH